MHKRLISKRKIDKKKLIISIIPIILVGYLLVYQFLIPKEFNYFYDIGSEEDTNFLTPNNRISDRIIDDEISYRLLKDDLVYFWIDPPRGFTDVYIVAKIKPNIPENFNIALGIRDNKINWSYKYHVVYNYTKNIDKWVIVNTTFNVNKDRVYLINNGRLSLLFNTPHLREEYHYQNYTIPIDWINITVYKPGLLKKSKK